MNNSINEVADAPNVIATNCSAQLSGKMSYPTLFTLIKQFKELDLLSFTSWAKGKANANGKYRREIFSCNWIDQCERNINCQGGSKILLKLCRENLNMKRVSVDPGLCNVNVLHTYSR